MDEHPSGPEPDLIDAWLTSVTGEAPPSLEDSAGGTLVDALAAAPLAPDPEPSGLAAPAPAAEPARPHRRLVLFTVAGATYGVPDALVTEVGRVPKTTPVPLTPPWLRGVTSLRGDVLSVVDLRTWLGLEAASSHTSRLLVVRLTDDEFSTGLLVDSVDHIASVPIDDVRPPASALDGALADYLTGACHVANAFVAVLDLERLLRSPEIRQFDDARDATTRSDHAK